MDAWWTTIESTISWETIVRLLLASVAGAALGWERERHSKPAGLRTHMLVALGAATFMLATLDWVDSYEGQHEGLRLDPIRVIAGIIGGVGFLGAGTIIEARGDVRGITTAASIWLSAAVGTACGLGMYAITFTSVILALLTLIIVRPLEVRVLDSKDPGKRGGDE